MKLAILLLALVFTVNTNLFAQILSPVNTGSYGRSSLNGGVLLEDNIGSIQVSTLSTPTFMYTQGFLQPDAGTTNIVPPINDVTLSGGFALDNAGTTFSAGSAMIDFTLGETASITLNSANNMVTQGILQPYGGHYWTGLVNTDWKNVNNWSPAYEPTRADDVIIPAFCPHYPVITNSIIAHCKSLSAMPGTSVNVNTGGQLNVYQ